MHGTHNLWLVVAAYAIAVAWSIAMFEVARRLTVAKGLAGWAWLAAGAVASSVGLWSVHFIALLALRLPVPLVLDIPITGAAVVSAALLSALALWLARHPGPHGLRSWIAGAALGCAITVVHYSGMTALRISLPVTYSPSWILVSIAVAVAAACATLRTGWAVSIHQSLFKKGAAALAIGGAMIAVHYTGMAAARSAPDTLSTLAPVAIDNTWLASLVACNAMVILVAVVATAAYDARITAKRLGVGRRVETAGPDACRPRERRDTRIVKHLIDRVMHAPSDVGDSVTSWVLPVGYFSGDLVAAARTPSGVMHVMVADGTGHGLSAALSTLPVAQPFYAMTAKGFTVASLVEEINTKMRATLPIGRFVAACIASIDPRSRVIQVWNGGSPVCHVVSAEGISLKRFRSSHVPLGILSEVEFDSQVESFQYEAGWQMVLGSDGLLDVENDAGLAFGERGMLEVLAEAPPAHRSTAVRAAIRRHLGHRHPHDDISFLIVDCGRVEIAKAISRKPSARVAYRDRS